MTCSFKGCKDPATIIVSRNRKPYCRGHGLAEASKRPACEIDAIPLPIDHTSAVRAPAVTDRSPEEMS